MRRALAALAVVATLAGGDTGPAHARPSGPERSAQASPTVDPKLLKDLRTVISVSPPASCLTVKIGGTVVYQHGGSSPQTPASTEKLITAGAALDLLGGDFRFTTAAVPSVPPAAGVVRGDLALVGGGDPVLTSSLYRAVRKLPADRTLTLLDDLAQRVRDAGITHVTGRVLGDESRYDSLRVVPSWPDRYARQEQAGPLSALDVDDGYRLEVDGDRIVRKRTEDPALAAADLFTKILGAKGVKVDAPPAVGRATAGTTAITIASPPLTEIVSDMLQRSDNQTAELLVKELGRSKGGGGSSAAGVAVVTRWRADHGLALPGTLTQDGSGLDPANRVTCDELVTLLDQGAGRDGTVGRSLPVAGESGTLAHRFRRSPAVGRLRAKTGSLNSVTALAGFVDLLEGGHATFAYIANGEAVSAKVLAAQDLLATILATYLPPCAEPTVHDVALPAPLPASLVATLSSGPGLAGAGPGMAVALDVLQDSATVAADRCLAADRKAQVRLLP